MGGPRIGRPDRLHAPAPAPLGRGQPRVRTVGGGPGYRLLPPPLVRLETAEPVVEVPPAAPPPAWDAVQACTVALAQQLGPLPGALDELAMRINRHCAVAGRDAEIARLVALVRGRTFDLLGAVHRLREAAGTVPSTVPKPTP